MDTRGDRQAWDRQVSGDRVESPQAYEAFCAYRDMPRPRSVDGAYRMHVERRAGGDGEKPARSASGRWWTWCSDFDWVRRVEAYDGYLELRRRSENEEQHVRHLSAHLDRMRQISVAQQTISLTMFGSAQRVIQGHATDLDKELVGHKTLASFIRAAERLSTRAIDIEGQSLGVAELIGLLGDDEQQNGRA